MDIHEFARKYDISLKKASRMAKDGALRTGRSTVPIYWRRTRENIQKGKMSALAIALAYRFPDKLRSIMCLTPAGKRVIDRHIEKSVKVRTIEPRPGLAPYLCVLAEGMGQREHFRLEFINILKQVIPKYPVDYCYIAVRIFLVSENENQMVDLNKHIRGALLSSIEHPSMEGWWHREHVSNGKHRIIYHRPETLTYDL